MADLDPALLEAFMRVSKRKQTVGRATDPEGHDGHVVVDGTVAMFMGTGVPPDQLLWMASKMAKTALAALLLDEIEIPNALHSQWIEGFLVGVELGHVQREMNAEVER